MTMRVTVIRISGAREEHEVLHPSGAIRAIRKLIGAECLDSVNLRDGRVMLVDDTGMVDGRPVNPEATKLYWSICRAGTTHPICGDVAIARDEDFA